MEKQKEEPKKIVLVPEHLSKWTKEELIDFIIKHKGEINLQSHPPFPPLPDFTKYEMIHVALLLAYCGHNYQGLAVQADTKETVESKLFDALRRTCLIENWKTWYEWIKN